jgi:hypothetical protein
MRSQVRDAGGSGMKFLGEILLVVLLCVCGAWILAALLAFAWNVEPVDFNSPSIRFLAWLNPRRL